MAVDSNHPMTSAELEMEFSRLLGEMDSDTRIAFEKLMTWMTERPKGSEPLGEERIGQMIEEVRLENIRRRPGGKIGEVLPFKKLDSKQ